MRKPLISIITVTFNCESTIRNTIESVISQDYSNVEYIIIDGKSNDNTVSIIREYGTKINKIISEKDYGIFDAMNKGISLAEGDWLIFINSGDSFVDSSTLSKCFDELSISDNVGVLYGDAIFVNKNGQQSFYRGCPFFMQRQSYKEMGICHQSIFTKVSIAKNNKFDLSYRLASDYNMMNHIYKMGFEFHYLGIPISLYSLDGVSSKHKIMQFKEVAQICGVKKSSLAYLLNYLNVICVLLKTYCYDILNNKR